MTNVTSATATVNATPRRRDVKSRLWHPELAAEIARQDYTFVEVAAEVGCHPGTISRIIRGLCIPGSPLRGRIAAFLGVDENVLFQVNPAFGAAAQTVGDADARHA